MISNDHQRELLLKRWKAIEQSIVADSDHEYNLQWGTLREKFYEENGPIPCSSADMERLSMLKGVFKGERIFILGNGPSLNQTPLDYLKDEFTFVTNRFYLMFDRIDWRPTFYTATDWRVVPDIAHEINLLTGMIFFFEERFKGLLRGDDEDIYWYTDMSDPREKKFAYDMTKGILGAGSVTGTAIQIAFYLGFSPIYLIGCDLGYKIGQTVKQEGPDKFGTGTKLYLTSTEDDDFSHFDKRYFGKDRRWHDPHVERMIEGHKQCKEGVEKAGGKIYNATTGGELEVYERVDFKSLFPRPKHMVGKQLLQKIRKPIEVIYPVPEPWKENCLLGPFARCEHANINETRIAFHLLKHTEAGVMVDVGAHHASSLLPFAENGWRIYAFEPDTQNRSILDRKVSAFRNVSVDKRAVSDTTERSVPFYSSSESSGISCLKPFTNSHVYAGTVDTVTLTDFCSEQKISHIDLLKIDAEGYDLLILKGVSWDNIKPNVIICEFEDSKTRSLGYTMHDMARYLVERGYKVLVSEWHPVIRYGIQHDWRRLVPYPCELDDPNATGNLIAFREQPDLQEIATIARRIVKVDAEMAKRRGTRVTNLTDRELYQRLVDYLKTHYPTIITIGRFVKWSLSKLKRSFFGIGGIFLLVIAGLYIAGAFIEPLRWYLVGTATALLLLGGGLLALSYVRVLLDDFVSSQRRAMQAITSAPTNRQLDQQEKQARWRTIKNLHRGQRAFLIGNGPSLNRTPLHLLKDEFTLCFNRFDLLFERLGWRPTLYMCVDRRVAEDTAPEINRIIPLVTFAFFPDAPLFHSAVEDAGNVLWLSLKEFGFHDDLPICGQGGTVSHVGLQVLAFMGFSPIYLVGVDMDYKDHGTALKHDKMNWTSTQNDDPNHFDPRYFGTGRKYHYPRLHEDMLPSLQRAKEHLDGKGVKVLNAGIGGSLEIFPRVDFRSLFNFEEDIELEMLLDAIHPELRRGALQALRGDKVVKVRDDWDEKTLFQVTTLQLAEQLMPKVIFTHIPYGPFGDRYLFIRRERLSTATATTAAR